MIYSKDGVISNNCLSCEAYNNYYKTVQFRKSSAKIGSNSKKDKKKPVYNITFDERDKVLNLEHFLQLGKLEKVSFYWEAYGTDSSPKSAEFIMCMQFRMVVGLIKRGMYIYRKKGG